MNTRIIRALSAAGLATLCFASLPTASTATTAYTWDPIVGNTTWDTATANWTTDGGATTTTWVSGNDALFSGSSSFTVTGGPLTLNSLQMSTTAGTINLSITSLDVANISTVGGSIDMFSKITGNHDLTFTSSGAGRLNIKVANDYTGDTYLTGSAYLLSDGTSNSLPTGTILNMDTGTIFRVAKIGGSQQLAGLVSTNTNAGTISDTVGGYTLTISTKSSTTTTFSGAISNNSSNTLSLVINGSGTQALNGNNGFYGTTTVSGGTLSLGSNLTNNSAVTVSGGLLTSSINNINLGTGAVSMSSGEISIRGTGAGGTFTVAANQVFSTTGGKLTFNLGTSIDQIKGSGTGTFSIGSGTELALITGTGFSYSSTYQLLSGFASGSVTSSGLTITGYDTTNYLATLDNTGLLSFASAIPEPSTYAALAGLAVLGLVTLRRRARC